MDKIILTADELEILKSIQTQHQELLINFGQIEIAMHSLDSQKQGLKNSLTKLEEYRNQIGKNLQEKYGNGNINIETGEFNKID